MFLTALALASNGALAGDFMDIWVTTAIEDTNLRAGPGDFSPSPNFVQRGNQIFFENYEAFWTDDISQGHLVLYREDEGFRPNWTTEAAFVLEYTPFLNPDVTRPGVNVRDDGSYVRIIRSFNGDKKHNISLTGYAVDASRFRLGYSFDLSYGGREIISPQPGAMPGVRLQYQNNGSYAFLGAKTAVNQAESAEWEGTRNAAYYSVLAGAGLDFQGKLRIEAGTGLFQQGQIINVQDTSSPLYGEMITAWGTSGQVSYRSTTDIPFIQSSELRLYRNSPEYMRDTYITNRFLEGFGFLVQAEINSLVHNLLDPDDTSATILERGFAGDIQTAVIFGSTELFADLVYKDLPYIVFNIPGLTSGAAISEKVSHTPQIYGRVRVAHNFPAAHFTPSVGVGLMQPATYTTTDGSTYVQYDARNKEGVPTGEPAYAVLGSVIGAQYELSKSTVVLGELLINLDNNQSRVVDSDDGVRIREREDPRVTNAVGFNLMLRSHF
jgi:hypothetical protein